MKNKKAQFILHKILLIAFISVCILSTAASCSSNPKDKKNETVFQSSSAIDSSIIKQKTSIQSTTSMLDKLNDNSKDDQNPKTESGTLNIRNSEKIKDKVVTNNQKPEIQSNIEPIPSTIEIIKSIVVESQPIVEKWTETLPYIAPIITEQQPILPMVSQSPPKEIITAPIQNIQPTAIETQNLISTNSNLRCSDIGHRVYRGNPDYSPHLDRDGDGIGCESYKK